jgi:predicted Zn finger-like uncharacterized protein
MEIICHKCNSVYQIPENNIPQHKVQVKCKKCQGKIIINPGQVKESENEPLAQQQAPNQNVIGEMEDMRFKEYKVLEVMEGGCGTVLVGSSKIPVKKMEEALNAAAIEGWQVVFQVIEAKRFLLFWKRESIIITLGR